MEQLLVYLHRVVRFGYLFVAKIYRETLSGFRHFLWQAIWVHFVDGIDRVHKMIRGLRFSLNQIIPLTVYY